MDIRDSEPAIEVRQDVRIPTGDRATTLSADIYLPAGEAAAPTLVTIVPYRKDFGSGYVPSLRWFASQGYACVLVDHQGIGSSDGVPHSPWGPGETDDAVAVIEWAATQPWCDGNVGMWGISHGGFTSMSAAARRPTPLKAIIPMMNALDVERDIMHPEGARGDLVRLALWGGSQLLQQLLPPLLNTTSVAEQRRWRHRLHDIEPFILELAQLAPGDPAWRDRVIDAEAITVPTLCVGGWQDVYPDAVPRAYERIQAPKKLLIGPWGHTLPQDSPFEPTDFLPIALRWWDRWLRGADNGVTDEPPVTVYLQGADPGWRSFESWPPAKRELILTSTGGAALTEEGTGEPHTGTRPAEYRPDPTTGVLSGLRGIALGSLGLPLDQHDDDMRALSVTSEPLTDELIICGRPEVVVTTTSAAGPVPRLVVRLTDVDEHGRSRFITSGVLCPEHPNGTYQVTLAAAAHRVARGHRLRAVISDSDFPRLVPLPSAPTIRLDTIDLFVPTVPAEAGTETDLPVVATTTAHASAADTQWTISRNPLCDQIEIAIERAGPTITTGDGHQLETRTEYRSTVRSGTPEASTISATHHAVARLTTGATVTAHVTVHCTQTDLWVRGELRTDDLPLFSKVWEATLENSCNVADAAHPKPEFPVSV
ncbi:CocE/NonD family hydrolase [Saccharomonospora sp. NPDC046836]|uniref:CocE/NonD family hydrolase n=1 Tax=Saccharomonospora sp. NPDC046836 TaxID=3156921 RepID=UPI0033DEACB8